MRQLDPRPRPYGPRQHFAARGVWRVARVDSRDVQNVKAEQDTLGRVISETRLPLAHASLQCGKRWLAMFKCDHLGVKHQGLYGLRGQLFDYMGKIGCVI
jgi:hypothetical protein